MSDTWPRDLQLHRRALSDREQVDLTVTGAASSRDLATVDDIDNLEQALVQRLLVRKGELRLHPDYGSRLHELFGAPLNQRTEKLASAYIYQALSADPRVREVEDIVITAQRPSTLRVRVQVRVSRETLMTLATDIHV